MRDLGISVGPVLAARASLPPGMLLCLLLAGCGGGGGGGGGGDTGGSGAPPAPPANRVPVAAAGADQTVQQGAAFQLEGGASSDADGDPLTYTWSQVSGPTVTLVPETPSRVRGTAPASLGVLQFSLVVRDANGASAPDTINVNVVAEPSNRPPIANAGPDRTVRRNQPVSILGQGQDLDGQPLSYRWAQTGGAPVQTGPLDSRLLQFNAPAGEADLRFALTTNDGALDSVADTVTVLVRNASPVIAGQAIAPASPRTNDTLTVNPTITDPDGDSVTVTYAWRRNGTLLAGRTGSTIPPGDTTRGDVFVVTITASDGTATASADATITIADSPPVLAASAPASATYGQSLSFTVTATDDDGDPVNFAVDYAPAGFDVDGSTGVATWRPTGPLFDRTTDFNWGIRTTTEPFSVLSGSIRVTDTARRYPWFRAAPTSPYGQDALEVADFDGDGDREIMVAGVGSIAETSRVGAGYEQTWAYPFAIASGGGLGAPAYLGLASADLDNDGKRELFVSTSSALAKLDGATRREVARVDTVATEGGNCRALEIADVDGDAGPDLLCLLALPNSVVRVVVLNPAMLATRWVSAVRPDTFSFAVGNVDADPAVEIVLAEGAVIDGATRQLQWLYSAGFGTWVDVGDLDGDGRDEIVATGRSSDFTQVLVRVFDGVAQALRVSQVHAGSIGPLAVEDFEGDARPEIVVAPLQFGPVVGYRYVTPAALQSVFSLSGSLLDSAAIAVGNLDADPGPEFVFASGTGGSGADVLYVAGFNPTIGVEWSSSFDTDAVEFTSYAGGSLARLAGGARRLAYRLSAYGSLSSSTRVALLDPALGRFTVGSALGNADPADASIETGDYDGDGLDEAFVSSATVPGTPPFGSVAVAYDLQDGVRNFTTPVSDRPYGAIGRGDLDGDGRDDFATITGLGVVQAWNVATQSQIWSGSTSVLGVARRTRIVDVDGDGVREIVAATSERVTVFGRAATSGPFAERAGRTAPDVEDVLVADLDGVGGPEIYVLRTASLGASVVEVLDVQMRLQRTLNLGTVFARVLALEPSAFARKNLVVGASDLFAEGRGAVLAISPANAATVWRSPPLAGGVERSSLQFVDVDGDGTSEISFATRRGMFVTR